MACFVCKGIALSGGLCSLCAEKLPPERLREVMKQIERTNSESGQMRVLCDQGSPTPDIYYRRMSKGEYDAIHSIKSKVNIGAALTYNNAKNYRLWLSTSKKKCEVFGNENNDTSGFVTKVSFSSGFSKAVTNNMKPHQMKGVQGSPEIVAYHREGFAQLGNVSTMEEMNQLMKDNKHYNIGLTLQHLTVLNQYIKLVEKFD